MDCAILEPYYSTADEPKNKEYPIGSNLWCSFQRETANHMNKHVPIKDTFFDIADSERFLAACEQSKTHNVSGSYQGVVGD